MAKLLTYKRILWMVWCLCGINYKPLGLKVERSRRQRLKVMTDKEKPRLGAIVKEY